MKVWRVSYEVRYLKYSSSRDVYRGRLLIRATSLKAARRRAEAILTGWMTRRNSEDLEPWRVFDQQNFHVTTVTAFKQPSEHLVVYEGAA